VKNDQGKTVSIGGRNSAKVRLRCGYQSSRISAGGPPVDVSFPSAGESVNIDFGATKGNRRAFVMTGFNQNLNGASTGVTLYRPDGSTIESTDAWFVNHDGGFWGPFKIDATGTWRVVIDAPDDDLTGGTIQLLRVPPDFRARMTAGDPAVKVDFTGAGQVARMNFGATAKNERGLMINGLNQALFESATIITLYRPDGTVFESTDGWFVNNQGGYWGPFNLDDTGRWRVVIDPPGTDTTDGAVQLLVVPPDFRARMTAGGPAVNVHFAGPGQIAQVDFGATTGDDRSFSITGLKQSLYGSSTGITLYRPDGTIFDSTDAWFVNNNHGTWGPFNLDATGTWTVVMDPPGPDVTDGTIQLLSAS
jgi:hypothetical protein